MPGLSDNNSALPPPGKGRPGREPPPSEAWPGRPRARTRLAAPFALLLALAFAASLVDAKAPKPPPKPRLPPPVAVIAAFDSLLDAGDFAAAKALTAGQVLRMFDFLAMTHRQMAGLIDSARSSEDTLDDSVSGDWAWVKLSSHVVFKQPFLGQSELRSIQAIHLWRSDRGWLIAEFQELESGKEKVAFRSGPPAGSAPESDSARADPMRALLPVSPKAPAQPGQADFLRYRLLLRNGEPLATLAATGPGPGPGPKAAAGFLDARQAKVEEISPSEWILENRLAVLPPVKRKTPPLRDPAPDSLLPYLASNAYLVLEDSLLRDAARKAAGPSADPVRIAAATRKWVSGGFRFRLGAVLFGTSREVLRDMTGDCSEAAILTAALLRASRVPARVALGFASAGRGVFIGHAWTEAWLGDDLGWVGVDAALGQFPAGVERVKLAHLDGAADMRIAATNLMLAALSNIDIEILEASRKGKPLPLVVHPGAAEEGAEFFAEILRGFGAGEER